jgi:hypothetical protein
MALALLAARPALAAPCNQTAWQTWDTFMDYHPIGETTDLLMAAGIRTDCGLGGNIDPYFQQVVAGVTLQPFKHLQIFPFYDFVMEQAAASRYHGFNLEFRANNFEFHHWGLNDANRMEEDLQPTGDTTRYTNQLELTRRVRLHATEFETYAKGYAKYDLKYLSWAYERVYVGARKPLTPKLTLDVYYLRQYGTHLVTGNKNAIGLTVRARF